MTDGRRFVVRVIGTLLVISAAVLWVVGSFHANWSDVSSQLWGRSYELIWLTESAMVVTAACCAYWSPRAATALLLPAIVFRIIGLGQFYVPKSGFTGQATTSTWVSWVGLGFAVLGFVVLALIARPFWGLTRSSLLITMGVLVVALGWSVAAALPSIHYYVRAPAGQTWKSNGQQVFQTSCCVITDATLTAGEKITLWAQVVAAPLVVFITGLRAGRTMQGLGWISAGGIMGAVGLSMLQRLGPFFYDNNQTYATAWILPAGIVVILGGAVVFLVGVTSSLWSSAGRLPTSEERSIDYAV